MRYSCDSDQQIHLSHSLAPHHPQAVSLAEQWSGLLNAQKMPAGVHLWVWALTSLTGYLFSTALCSLYLEITGPRVNVAVEVAHLTLRFAQLLLPVPQTLGCAS